LLNVRQDKNEVFGYAQGPDPTVGFPDPALVCGGVSDHDDPRRQYEGAPEAEPGWGRTSQRLFPVVTWAAPVALIFYFWSQIGRTFSHWRCSL
jgi:hypothetical protein